MLRDEESGLPGVRRNGDAISIYPEWGASTFVLFASTRSPGDKLTKWPAVLPSRDDERSEINAPKVFVYLKHSETAVAGVGLRGEGRARASFTPS